MKFTCSRSLLAEAISGVSKAVSPRSGQPILEGILFQAEGFSLTLTGYDCSMAIITQLEANILEPGEAVLHAKLLGDMVRRLSTEEVEICVAENGTATIKSGITEFNIHAMPVTDYPELPIPSAEPTLDLSAAELKEIVETTLYAVSLDETKPSHTGELFEITPDALRVVALDGYRLAIVEKKVAAQKEISIIVPGKTLSDVIKLFGDSDDTVHISADRRFVVFANEHYKVFSRLLEGQFLDYKRVIPAAGSTRVVVDVRDFIDVIERASLIITERAKNPLRVLFDQTITVRCQTGLGAVVDELPASIEGEPVEVGFNNRYLLDALRNSRCDKVAMEISGPLSPVKVMPVDGEQFLFLVLPIRFKND